MHRPETERFRSRVRHPTLVAFLLGSFFFILNQLFATPPEVIPPQPDGHSFRLGGYEFAFESFRCRPVEARSAERTRALQRCRLVMNVLNASSTSGHPVGVRVTLLAVNGLGFPTVDASGTALRADIFPGEGAKASFEFRAPAGLVFTRAEFGHALSEAQGAIAIEP
jgi:hypothetical protein